MNGRIALLALAAFASLLDVRAADPRRIRIVAANLTSGSGQSYDPGHGLRILQGLKPDVILVQEFRFGDNSPAAIRKMVDRIAGTGFSLFREEPRSNGAIPNGIISRWPILASGVWDDQAVGNREFAWARIDIPGDIDLWVVSLHLLTNDRVRPDEARQLASYIERNVPRQAYLAVGGDLNTDNMRDRTFRAFDGVVVIPAKLPADARGTTGTNRNRGKPYDHVLADADLERHATPVLIGMQRFETGLVFDSRVFRPLSDVAPVRSDDSGTQNMQHMAVVRDFLVPIQ